MADVSDLVLDDERHLGAHGEADLGRQARGLGEHVEVSAREGQGDRLLFEDVFSIELTLFPNNVQGDPPGRLLTFVVIKLKVAFFCDGTYVLMSTKLKLVIILTGHPVNTV